MYFPPNKSMKPDFINFIVEILEKAFWKAGFHQVPWALQQSFPWILEMFFLLL